MSDDTSGDPFAEGREAHDAGKSETANPYPEDSDAHLSWNDGWIAAGRGSGRGMSATKRAIVIRGDFTDAEFTELVGLIRTMDSARPGTFVEIINVDAGPGSMEIADQILRGDA